MVESHNIRVVPHSVIFGDRVYRDGIDLSPSNFYVLLERANELPTTSAPSPEAFLEAYCKVGQERKTIVCILVTSGFSSMALSSAIKAREMAGEVLPETTIEIIDSRTAVGAMGFIVSAAARAAAQGDDLAGVVKAAEEVKARVTLIGALDTLKYLAKGGRIGKAAYLASSLLNIKPIIEVPPSTGVVEPLERVRTKRRALRRMTAIMEERVDIKEPVHVSIDHAKVPHEAEWLREQVSSRFNCVELWINEWTPVAGVHCGPGVIGLSFYAED